MEAITINAGKTAIVDIVNVFSGHSFGLVLERFEADDVTPKDFEGTFTLPVYKDARRSILTMTLTESSGLIRDGNTLAIVFKKNHKLSPGTYYYDLHDDIDTDTSYPVTQGTITVNYSR